MEEIKTIPEGTSLPEADPGAEAPRKGRRSRKMSILLWILLVVLALYAISMICMILWGVFTAFKDQREFRKNVLWIPGEWTIRNFLLVAIKLKPLVQAPDGSQFYVGVGQMIVYTLLYAGGGAFFSTLVPCIVAYVTAKFPYKFSSVIYMVVVVTMVLPIVGKDASELQLVRMLGIYDTVIGSWIQKFNFLGMYYLVFYATFKSMPNDYAEAAYVDGAGETRVLFSIVMPLVINVFGTVMLIKFVELWNDYQTPLLYQPSHPTLAYGIYWQSNSSDQELTNVPARMAGCAILVIPILVLFLIFKEKLMNNISMGGVKE